MRSYEKWAEIVDPGSFTLKLPITPYRSFNKGTITNNVRTVSGISEVISESASIAVMAQGIGFGSPLWVQGLKDGASCYMAHEVDPADIIVSGDQIICRFKTKLVGRDNYVQQHECRYSYSVILLFPLLFLFVVSLCLSLSRSIAPCSHSLTPHDTSLTIIPPSINHHQSTQYSHYLLLPCRQADQPSEGSLQRPEQDRECRDHV
jgi:hypothetical protein